MGNDGWIKLHRKILDNPIIGNINLFTLICYLLLRVNHKKASIYIKNTKYDLLPGQGIVSQKDLSKKFNVSLSTINKRLLCLKNEKIIETKGDNKCTVITFINRNLYQWEWNQNESKAKPERNQSETNKNDKNEKKYKEEDEKLILNKKTEFIAKIRDAKNRWKTYIFEWENFTKRKVITNDKIWVKLGDIISQIWIDEFIWIIKKYIKIWKIVKKNNKYVYDAYKTLDLYSFEKFIEKIDLFLKEEDEIINQIQDQKQGNELLKIWKKQNIPKDVLPKKVLIQEEKLTPEQQKENIEKLKFNRRCIFEVRLWHKRATELWQSAREKNIDPFDLAEEEIKNNKKNI